MAENSKIEWTDHTFNGHIGCTKVSPACDHCYAEAWGKRFGVEWGKGAARRLTSDQNWQKPLRWNRLAEAAGERYRVFSNSLSDWADTEVPDAWRDRLFARAAETPNLDWLLLTKRPKVARRYINKRMESGLAWPLPNVWIGTTVENQSMADLRIPQLLQMPAARRFLSVEPLLGPIDLRGHLPDWIIVGGESGPHARPMHLAWARSIRDQCQVAGVPFFMKQMARKAPIPNDLLIREFPT